VPRFIVAETVMRDVLPVATLKNAREKENSDQDVEVCSGHCASNSSGSYLQKLTTARDESLGEHTSILVEGPPSQ
jgi:hypothetical protein